VDKLRSVVIADVLRLLRRTRTCPTYKCAAAQQTGGIRALTTRNLHPQQAIARCAF
jgi:hypothetical protein